MRTQCDHLAPAAQNYHIVDPRRRVAFHEQQNSRWLMRLQSSVTNWIYLWETVLTFVFLRTSWYSAVILFYFTRDVTLRWAVQKWLNRLRCRLGCGLGGPKQACVTEVHIDATWRTRLNLSCSARPCKNGWTDRDTVWGVDLDGPKE